MSFLITGHGRSGTSWLARELGKADGWTVEHEPEWVPSSVPKFYGCVDSRARDIPPLSIYYQRWPYERWDELAWVDRDPVDIFRSSMRWRAWDPAELIEQIKAAQSCREHWVAAGAFVVQVERLWADVRALVRFARSLGVELDPSRVDLSPANTSADKLEHGGTGREPTAEELQMAVESL